MLEESEEPETPGIREYCDVCDKFADLKNGYNYYTDESVRICEECLTHNARFRGGKRGQEEDEGETDLGLSL